MRIYILGHLLFHCVLFSRQTQMNETGAYGIFKSCISCLVDFEFYTRPISKMDQHGRKQELDYYLLSRNIWLYWMCITSIYIFRCTIDLPMQITILICLVE